MRSSQYLRTTKLQIKKRRRKKLDLLPQVLEPKLLLPLVVLDKVGLVGQVGQVGLVLEEEARSEHRKKKRRENKL